MEDGRELRRELVANLRRASEPARQAAQTSIMSMASAGGYDGEPLREAISRRIVTEARLTGRATGARVKAKKLLPTVRGFVNAPKRTNATHWRRQVFGRGVWVEQVGKPQWFDDAMRENREEWQRGVRDALQDMARKIARRTRTGV